VAEELAETNFSTQGAGFLPSREGLAPTRS
jgi:hypothetical protein